MLAGSCPRVVIAPNEKHSLEEQLWHLAVTTKVAPLQVARLGWLARPAKLPLCGFCRRTRKTCHWSWNVKSTVRKARSSRMQNQPGSSWENWWLPTTSQLHFLALHNLHLVTSCPKVVYNSWTAAFAVENRRGTLLLQHQQMHACHWQD